MNLKREQQKLSTEEQEEWEWNKSERASETCGTTDQHTCNGRGKERLEKYLKKIMSENSANLIENINLYMHVAQQTQLG